MHNERIMSARYDSTVVFLMVVVVFICFSFLLASQQPGDLFSKPSVGLGLAAKRGTRVPLNFVRY